MGNPNFLTAAQIDEQRDELFAEVEAIYEAAQADNRELSDDEKSRVDSIQGADGKGGILAKLDGDYARKKAVEDRIRAKVDASKAIGQPLIVGDSASTEDILDRVRVPATAKRGNLKAFTDQREAYASGQFLAAIAGNKKSRQWCNDHGFMNAMSEGTDSAGGYAVPTPLASTIIRLVEEYGVFRRNTRVVPMTADVLNIPRRTAGVTVYYPNEGASITASDLTFAQATLTAKKFAALAVMSTELDEDAVISMADLIATEVGYAFAVAEDTQGFTGTGSPINGLADVLAAGAKYTAATGETTVASLDLADYHETIGKVNRYPGAMNKWYVNQVTWATSMQPLMYAAGGNTTGSIANGVPMEFMGYPVEISQVLPDDGASNIVAYFGDLSLAATMGDRRNVSLQTLRELYAATDQVGIVATERVAITVHETTGPVSCLVLAAS